MAPGWRGGRPVGGDEGGGGGGGGAKDPGAQPGAKPGWRVEQGFLGFYIRQTQWNVCQECGNGRITGRHCDTVQDVRFSSEAVVACLRGGRGRRRTCLRSSSTIRKREISSTCPRAPNRPTPRRSSPSSRCFPKRTAIRCLPNPSFPQGGQGGERKGRIQSLRSEKWW